MFLKDAELVTGETVAIDRTKVRAHNSKNNNLSPRCSGVWKIGKYLVIISAL